jgi:hypothetical protein
MKGVLMAPFFVSMISNNQETSVNAQTNTNQYKPINIQLIINLYIFKSCMQILNIITPQIEG